MKHDIPRVMIVGTGSGCGKTTVTCALLSALKEKTIDVTAFKCGPDYIDPMFHSEVLKTKSRNLDLYLCGEEGVRYLLRKNGEGSEVCVIEGVMGMYDGLGFADDSYSANHIARVTECPQILVCNVKGKSLSVLAELSGYLNFRENRLKGVILNGCSPMMYPAYRNMIEENLPLKCYGYFPKMEAAEIGSRHLGLVTAEEISDLRERLAVLGRQAAESIDLDGILQLAQDAPPLASEPMEIPYLGSIKIAVARDRAFCFYYEDNFDLLRRLGAELVFFSPLAGETIPKDAKGLILGGGYPELYLEQLQENTAFMDDLRKAASAGLPIYAECGGFMVLGESIETEDGCYAMAGVVSGHCKMKDRLIRFGYKELIAQRDTVFCEEGEKIRCHEFHYSDTDAYGDAFLAVNRRGQEFQTVHGNRSLYAGYPHLHLWANPAFAEHFVKACIGFPKGGKGWKS